MAKHKNGGTGGYTPFTGAASPTAQADAPPKADNPVKKTECKVSKARFAKHAKTLHLQVEGVPHPILVYTKDFSTGSFGWYHSSKVEIEVDGVRVPCQVGLSFIVVGSKDAPVEPEQENA